MGSRTTTRTITITIRLVRWPDGCEVLCQMHISGHNELINSRRYSEFPDLLRMIGLVGDFRIWHFHWKNTKLFGTFVSVSYLRSSGSEKSGNGGTVFALTRQTRLEYCPCKGQF